MTDADTDPRLDAFRAKLRTDELRIAETRCWIWSVRPAQVTLGAGIVALRRFATRFCDVTPEEMTDLGRAVSLVERTLGRAFPFERINWLMLMMVDPPVHFHVLPRHGSPRDFHGRRFADAGWPGPPELAASSTETDVLVAVRDALRSASAGPGAR